MKFLNSFADVEAFYHSVKPVNGRKTPKWKDVRPLGVRSHKYWRVERVDDDTYMLSDGFYDWHYVEDDSKLEDFQAERVRKAAIVWDRIGDTERITMVNTPRNSTSYIRWQFFEMYLPKGLTFHRKSADNHLIMQGVEKFAFKRGYVPSHWECQAARRKGQPEPIDEIIPIEFERKIGTQTWTLASDPQTQTVVKVDKEAKAKIKPYSDKFYDWMLTVHHIFSPESMTHKELMTERMKAGVKTREDTMRMVREAIVDEESPNRALVAKMFVARCLENDDIDSLDDLFKVRAKWNQFVNVQCGIQRKVEV